MLTAVVVAFVSIGSVSIICARLGMHFGEEGGAVLQRRCILYIEHLGGSTIVSQH